MVFESFIRTKNLLIFKKTILKVIKINGNIPLKSSPEDIDLTTTILNTSNYDFENSSQNVIADFSVSNTKFYRVHFI